MLSRKPNKGKSWVKILYIRFFAENRRISRFYSLCAYIYVKSGKNRFTRILKTAKNSGYNTDICPKDAKTPTANTVGVYTIIYKYYSSGSVADSTGKVGSVAGFVCTWV